MTRRLYLGRLPPDTRSEDVNKFFDGYGHIVDTKIMTGFGFVEFESSTEAEDALRAFSGKPFMGADIVIEFAKESRPRREPYEDRGGSGPTRSRRPSGFRVLVTGISRDTSWQDLKDFGREAGSSVSFADIDRDQPGTGILEYLSKDDADYAVKELDGRDLRGRQVRVDHDDSRAGPDNYRRDDRGHRDDRYYDRSYRDDRGYSRRERSRSPRRYDPDGRRGGRASPSRRDYDDRRPSGDDYDRRSTRDDRRRDDDRAPPPTRSNGEPGWAR